jgi:hypothetical protein
MSLRSADWHYKRVYEVPKSDISRYFPWGIFTFGMLIGFILGVIIWTLR